MVKNLEIYSSVSKVNKRIFHKLVNLLKNELGFSIKSLSINLIGSDELRLINKKYLNHDFDTDVITFGYSEESEEIDADILISYSQAKINAKKYRVTFENELIRLVIHGILHLLKFDDQDVKSRRIMKQKEKELLNRFYFTLFASK